MFKVLQDRLSDLFGLFYPKICLSCSKNLLGNEEVICIGCSADLPLCNNWNDPDNKLILRFAGRVNVQGAAALFQFNKGSPVQHLIHALKYQGRQDVGEYIGKFLGSLFLQPDAVIKNIDLIIPVPLHYKKQKTRGYNQCDSFAKSLSEVMNVPWQSDVIIRNYESVSQTKKKKFDRWGNVEDIFSVKEKAILVGKHVLLVDDVVTTGATSETCLQTILKVPNTKVSFAAMAMAKGK